MGNRRTNANAGNDRSPAREKDENRTIAGRKSDAPRTWGVCFALTVAVVFLYHQTLDHKFLICDDGPLITGNDHVNTGLTWANVRWSLTSTHGGNWHPLTWLSYMVDADMSRLKIGGYRETNMGLHAAAAILLFLALRRMTGSFWPSALAAAMFAVHPQRVESVAWAAERKDVLCGVFWMCTLFLYGGYAKNPSWRRYSLVLLSFALALASKPMAVTLPCVLLLLDFWPLRRWSPQGEGSTQAVPQSLRRLIFEKLPLAGMSAAVCVVLLLAQRGAGATSMTLSIPLVDRLANAAVSAVAYLWQMAWPVNLAFFYPHPSMLGGAAAERLLWAGLAAAAGLAAVTTAVLFKANSRPYLAVGWLWYLGTLVPVIGLVQVGVQSRADRYTYLPSVGISIIIAWGAAEMASRWKRENWAVGIAAAVLIAWSAVSYHQIALWKNDFTLLEYTAKAAPDNYFAHTHLAIAYYYEIPPDKINSQEYRETLAAVGDHAEKAVQIAPNYDMAQGNLGVYYMAVGRLDEARRCAERAAQINPRVSGYHGNLGAIAMHRGEIARAIDAYKRVSELDPDSYLPHCRLATALILQGRQAEAAEHLREAVRLHPSNARSTKTFVNCLAQLSWILAVSPDDSVRNGPEAIETAQLGLRLSDQNPLLLRSLAAAQAETGHFRDAQRAARLALDIVYEWQRAVRQNGNPANQREPAELAGVLEKMLLDFEAEKPYRSL